MNWNLTAAYVTEYCTYRTIKPYADYLSCDLSVAAPCDSAPDCQPEEAARCECANYVDRLQMLQPTASCVEHEGEPRRFVWPTDQHQPLSIDGQPLDCKCNSTALEYSQRQVGRWARCTDLNASDAGVNSTDECTAKDDSKLTAGFFYSMPAAGECVANTLPGPMNGYGDSGADRSCSWSRTSQAYYVRGQEVLDVTGGMIAEDGTSTAAGLSAGAKAFAAIFQAHDEQHGVNRRCCGC